MILRNRIVVWRPLDTEFGRASWCFDGQSVSVRTLYGGKSEIANGINPADLACKLVRDIAVENGAKMRRYKDSPS
jgi:hypothetical protein